MQAPAGKRIQLTFTSFHLEAKSGCRYDHLEVSYGTFSKKFCGTRISSPFVSTGTTITVKMHTDAYVTRTGFRAEWTVLGERCNPANSDWTCCTATNKCDVGQGDCDSDSDCSGNLVCGYNNCPAGHSSMDCCRNP